VVARLHSRIFLVVVVKTEKVEPVVVTQLQVVQV
jgi:hypothetical protein